MKKNINFEELTLLDQINITVKSLLGKFPMLNLIDITNDVYLKIQSSNPTFISYIHRYAYVNMVTKQTIYERFKQHKKHSRHRDIDYVMDDLHGNTTYGDYVEHQTDFNLTEDEDRIERYVDKSYEIDIINTFKSILTYRQQVILDYLMKGINRRTICLKMKENEGIDISYQTVYNDVDEIKIAYNKYFNKNMKWK